MKNKIYLLLLLTSSSTLIFSNTNNTEKNLSEAKSILNKFINVQNLTQEAKEQIENLAFKFIDIESYPNYIARNFIDDVCKISELKVKLPSVVNALETSKNITNHVLVATKLLMLKKKFNLPEATSLNPALKDFIGNILQKRFMANRTSK